jgi:hypothetical protein
MVLIVMFGDDDRAARMLVVDSVTRFGYRFSAALAYSCVTSRM